MDAAPLWHSGLTCAQSGKLELIQKRVCRIILGQLYVHYDQALITLGLEKLICTRINLSTTFALRAFNSNKFNEWFVKSKNTHTMNLRSKRTLQEFPGKSKRFHNSPVPYFTRMINSSI